jgi:hypothetical protein
VHPEDRTVGLQQQLLADPVGPDDLVADQRLADRPGRPGPAHVAVGVVGVGHHPSEGMALKGLAGPLGLGELRHARSIPLPTGLGISNRRPAYVCGRGDTHDG